MLPLALTAKAVWKPLTLVAALAATGLGGYWYGSVTATHRAAQAVLSTEVGTQKRINEITRRSAKESERSAALLAEIAADRKDNERQLEAALNVPPRIVTITREVTDDGEPTSCVDDVLGAALPGDVIRVLDAGTR